MKRKSPVKLANPAGKSPGRAKAGATADQVGRHLDLSRQRVGQLEAEGVLSRDRGGRFDLDACRLAYLRWLRDAERRAVKTAAASRLQDAKARSVELKNAEAEGKLMETAECMDCLDEMVGVIRTGLSGLPARVTRDLALRDAIERELDAVFAKAADKFAEMAAQAEPKG